MRIEYYVAKTSGDTKQGSNQGKGSVDFPENPLVEDAGFEGADSYLQRVEGAVNQTIARAIRDAVQTADAALQQEAASWLWICCPDIAEQVDLPEICIDTLPMLAASYIMSDAGM